MNLIEKMKQYPKLGSSWKTDKGICNICGKKAEFKIEIQVNFFRGDDEVEKRCKEHKRTLTP